MGKAADYFLAIRAEPDQPGGPTAICRLRMLLKAMKRAYGFRCMSIEPTEEFDETKDESTTGEG